MLQLVHKCHECFITYIDFALFLQLLFTIGTGTVNMKLYIKLLVIASQGNVTTKMFLFLVIIFFKLTSTQIMQPNIHKNQKNQIFLIFA